MERDSFIAYRVWLDSAKMLTTDEQSLKEVAFAILEFGFYGKKYAGDDVVAKAIMMNAIPQMEANNRKCKNRGGAPKGNQFARKQPMVENKTTAPDNVNVNVNVNENVNDNDNDNENENENEKKNRSIARETLFGESDYSKFCLWLRENAPYLYENCEHIITEMELKKLLKSYTVAEICGIIVTIENRKDHRYKYTNLYLTAFNWLKREYGKPSERPVLR